MGQGEGRTHGRGLWIMKRQCGGPTMKNPDIQNFVGASLSLTTSLLLIHPSLHLSLLSNLPPKEAYPGRGRGARQDPIFASRRLSSYEWPFCPSPLVAHTMCLITNDMLTSFTERTIDQMHLYTGIFTYDTYNNLNWLQVVTMKVDLRLT